MTRPTANTEAGGAKVLILSDSTATTPVAKNPAAIQSSASGDANSPVGWLGVATHRDGDTLVGAGGFTPTTAPGVLLYGADGTTLVETTRKVRPIRVQEGGSVFMLPGPTFTGADPQVYQKPLTSVGGVFTCAANTANQGSFTTTLASNFGYITDLYVQLCVTSANASTLLILDASAGTTLFALNYAAAALPAATAAPMMAFHFSNPLRANAAAASFFVTTTGATTTWNLSANGYFAIS